jgi:Protein of unknown function (DUF2799)
MHRNAKVTASRSMSPDTCRAGTKALGKPTAAGLRPLTKPLLLAASVLAAGCAGMSDAQCRSANWYDVGYRDARFKLQSQADVYAQQCARHGVKVDAARYEQGLREGRYDFPDRMT